jgi:hypothetical protein
MPTTDYRGGAVPVDNENSIEQEPANFRGHMRSNP